MKVDTAKKLAIGIVSAGALIGGTQTILGGESLTLGNRLNMNADAALSAAIAQAENAIPSGVCHLPKQIPYGASSLWHSYKGKLTLHIKDYAEKTGNTVPNAVPSYSITAEDMHSEGLRGVLINETLNMMPNRYVPNTLSKGWLSTSAYHKRVECSLN